jgi:aspartate/methionine/tyrosine aminotransferase
VRKVLNNFLNRRLKPVKAIAPEHISVIDGVTSCFEGLGFALGDSGDGFLGRPSYGSFSHDLQKRAGITAVGVAFGAVGRISIDAIAKCEETLLSYRKPGSQRIRGVLPSSHNPLGCCYSPAALLAFMCLCYKYQIHLSADEAYALSRFHNARFRTPSLSRPPLPSTARASSTLPSSTCCGACLRTLARTAPARAVWYHRQTHRCCGPFIATAFRAAWRN